MHTWVEGRLGVGDERAVISERDEGQRILSSFPSRQLDGCHLPSLQFSLSSSAKQEQNPHLF